MRSLRKLLAFAAILAAGALTASGRAADTPPGPYFQVDLSKHVTHSLYEPMLNTPGNDLSALTTGLTEEKPLKTLKGIPFRINGAIIVGPGETTGGLTNGAVKLVQKVEGIPVGHKAERLYFLHATHFGQTKGEKVGAYIAHYADGTTAEIPIRVGLDIDDWWYPTTLQVPPPSEAEIAWSGKNDAASRQENPPFGVRLYLKTWKNPHPELEIKTLDMVTGEQKSGQGAAAPFLVALSGQ